MTVADHCRGCAPDQVIERLVARLRARPDEILTARRGKAIRLQVIVTGNGSQSFRIMVTATGSIALLEPANLAGEEFRPQLVLVGTAEELLDVTVGHVSWRSAIDAGTVIPYVDPGEVKPFLELVASELLDLLGDRED